MTYFEIPGPPQGKARARTFYNPKLGKHQSMTPDKTVLYENRIQQAFMAAKNKQTFFNKEPVEMHVVAYYPIPQSTSKKNRERMLNHELFPTKKPDCDNIAKVICDALNGIAYHDDTQVVNLTIKKAYIETEPKVAVTIGLFDGYPF